MRPDDGLPTGDNPMIEPGLDLPVDADLQALDTELNEAGAQARRQLYGRTQPTRVYAMDLKARLLGALPAPAAAGLAADVLLPRGVERGSRVRPELVTPGETWAPTPLAPQLERRTPTVLPRARWSILAAAMLSVAVVAGALGARFDWLFPTQVDPSATPASHAPATPRPSPAATDSAVLPAVSPAPAPPEATKAPEPTPKPTRAPRPTPTPKPDPTKPPLGALDLFAKACPGGVVLDWSKPSPAVGHYHVLRNIDGEIPATYPAEGTTEVETATTYGAGNTDGYDVVGGGKSATYRAFAFDADDELMAVSQAKTVNTQDRLDLGTLTIELHGPGSMTVSWAPESVPGGCFTYGKLVASEEDSDPSYAKGSPHLAAIGDQSTSEILLEGLPSGKTVWMRYEYVRTTGTGKFIVASSDVIQVTYP